MAFRLLADSGHRDNHSLDHTQVVKPCTIVCFNWISSRRMRISKLSNRSSPFSNRVIIAKARLSLEAVKYTNISCAGSPDVVSCVKQMSRDM